MEIPLSPEQQQAIEGLAAINGTSPVEQAAQLLADALQRAEDYDRWFRDKVRGGRAASERRDVIAHEEVGGILSARIRG